MKYKFIFSFCVVMLIGKVCFSQLNRYGFELEKKGNVYVLKDTLKIKNLLFSGKSFIDLPVDALIPYNEESVFINKSVHSNCLTSNYTYKKYDSYNLNLEVDKPKSDGKYPFIIWIHGGGWEAGDFYGFKNQSTYLAENGIIGVRISYSLLPQGGNMDSAWEDIKDAILFLKSHAEELQIDTAKMGFAGHSAGAHLAAYAAMRTPNTKLLMAFNGPYDLNNIMTGYEPTEHHFQFLGKTEKARTLASPINYVHVDAPFCLLGYSTGDYLVDPRQIELFEKKLNEYNVPHEIMIKKDYTHSCFLVTDMYEPTLMKMLLYAKKYLI